MRQAPKQGGPRLLGATSVQVTGYRLQVTGYRVQKYNTSISGCALGMTCLAAFDRGHMTWSEGGRTMEELQNGSSILLIYLLWVICACMS